MKVKQRFKYVIKKLLKNEGISWLKLIENHTKTPLFYGLPKVSKEGFPIRLIISRIASATHELTDTLAPYLEQLTPRI